MGFFDKIFRNKNRRVEIDFQKAGLNISDSGKESIRKFVSRTDKERLGDIIQLGDQGEQNYFYLIYYATLFDNDRNVRFAALKRLHNFKDNPNFEILIKKLEEPNVGEKLQPYYSMMLSRIGKISVTDFESRISGIPEEKINRKPLNNLKEAIKYVQENFKNTEETLLFSDELNDPVGVNIAILTDVILKAGYMPEGFDQKNGYRVYRYSKEIKRFANNA
ncbi:hypothetical protein BTO09_13815 [Gilvibacter sp. SZ-19]|uniref:hypothetical protein n=1 Tax=Gilvibacter sp. SZ-19 TaxID=754429 RepID=UPI000B3C1244|nr:hypothetical protein [Gilvibacter sp. SZ-19]ARV13350.1 hypothetical protein BTO09_13815 [Gilvibacter sp. SZ-19]